MSLQNKLLSLFRPEPQQTLSGALHGLTGRLDAAERAFFLSRNHLAVGQWAEDLVARLLVKQGMTQRERNVRVGASELDVIGFWRNTLVFVEVRCRRRNPLQEASETLGRRKWHSLARRSRAFGVAAAVGRPLAHRSGGSDGGAVAMAAGMVF